jgi:hypothetical protein
MKRALLAFLAGLLLCIPAAIVGHALNFGGFAWLVTLAVLMFVTSLFDREGFYGPRDPG